MLWQIHSAKRKQALEHSSCPNLQRHNAMSVYQPWRSIIPKLFGKLFETSASRKGWWPTWLFDAFSTNSHKPIAIRTRICGCKFWCIFGKVLTAKDRLSIFWGESYFIAAHLAWRAFNGCSRARWNALSAADKGELSSEHFLYAHTHVYIHTPTPTPPHTNCSIDNFNIILSNCLQLLSDNISRELLHDLNVLRVKCAIYSALPFGVDDETMKKVQWNE